MALFFLVMPPTYGSLLMFTGFLAYHHHSQFYVICIFIVSGGEPMKQVSLFCKIVRKMVSAMVRMAIWRVEYGVISFLGGVINLGSLHMSRSATLYDAFLR